VFILALSVARVSYAQPWLLQHDMCFPLACELAADILEVYVGVRGVEISGILEVWFKLLEEYHGAILLVGYCTRLSPGLRPRSQSIAVRFGDVFLQMRYSGQRCKSGDCVPGKHGGEPPARQQRCYMPVPKVLLFPHSGLSPE